MDTNSFNKDAFKEQLNNGSSIQIPIPNSIDLEKVKAEIEKNVYKDLEELKVTLDDLLSGEKG